MGAWKEWGVGLMKIISELSQSQIESSRRDGLATRLSIFLAIVLLGTVVFLIATVKRMQYEYIITTWGDYHLTVSDVDENLVDELTQNRDIESLSYDKYIPTDFNAVIIEKQAHSLELKPYSVTSGKKPSRSGEVIVPDRFLKEHRELQLGSTLKVGGKGYEIVGEYDDHGLSFEESALIGLLKDSEKATLLEEGTGLEAYIWFKNPRDTYSLSKELLAELDIDYSKALDTGRIYFNRDVLEYKMIYPSGLIPPKHVIRDMIETYGALMVLVLLFAVMIYGAFNVWNNRDIRDLALLKSVGMTEKQVKKMIRLKAFKISLLPVIIGLIVSYFTAGLLLYLMWLNNSLSYQKISSIFGEKMRAEGFEFAHLSVEAILIILILAFLTVFISALVPARKSAKLSIVEGLAGMVGTKARVGRSRIAGKIEATLAGDYFRAYLKTYKTIILALIVSALVMTLVLVTQSYRAVDGIYGSYKNPYPFVSQIHTAGDLDKGLIKDLREVEGLDEVHIYGARSFKFYLGDNPGFLSDELRGAFETGAKLEEEVFVKLLGLTDEDFDALIRENQLAEDAAYILLNKTPDSNRRPYAFRNYVPVSSGDEGKIAIRYSAEGEEIPIHLDGSISDLPFDLEGQSENGIYLFTRLKILEGFSEEYGMDEGHIENYYSITIKADRGLDEISDQCEAIIASYIPKSDFSTMTETMRRAMDEEQRRNEATLNLGVQLILIVLALSNAYNSFHGNLRARRREFQLLRAAGMTDKQMKRMIYGESRILFKYAALFYTLVFVLAVALRSLRSSYDFLFIAKELILHINYIPVVLIAGVMTLGIGLAIRSSMKKIID